MNEPRSSSDPIEALLRSAGRRAEPSAQMTDAVYQSALQVWEHTMQRRRRRGATWAAAAALMICVIGAALWTVNSRDAVVGVLAATVERVNGEVHRDGSSGRSVLRPGEKIFVGDMLRAAPGAGLSLVSPHGRTLRLASGFEAHFTTAQVLRIDSGRLYFESGDFSGVPMTLSAERFIVRTAAGDITHLGTRYAVLATERTVTVQVRDGRVGVSNSGNEIVVDAGTAVSLASRDGHVIERWDLNPSAANWLWADQLAPPLVIDRRTLAEVLGVLAVRSHRQLEFASDDVRAFCLSTRLHGPPIDLPPEQILAAVLAGTDLEPMTLPDRIIIRRMVSAE